MNIGDKILKHTLEKKPSVLNITKYKLKKIKYDKIYINKLTKNKKIKSKKVFNLFTFVYKSIV